VVGERVADPRESAVFSRDLLSEQIHDVEDRPAFPFGIVEPGEERRHGDLAEADR